MFTLLPHAMLFSLTLIFSTIAVISSSNFLIMWASLELNLMSLIPLMLMNKNKLESEAAVKYFLAQALGSSLFLISYMVISQNMTSDPLMPLTILSLALAIKLGAAPVHFWFPSVMASASWSICILLATWQKMAPLMMMSSLLNSTPTFLLIIASLSSIVGGVMGLNQTQLTALLAYSSIGHLGWTLAAIYSSAYMAIVYFFTYAVTTGLLMFTFHSINIFSIKQIPANALIPMNTMFIISILFLSLGGLPPLLGFLPKMMVLTLLSQSNQTILMTALIIGSTLNLSYYLVIMFNLYISSTSPPTTASHHPSPLPLAAMTTMPIFMLPYII